VKDVDGVAISDNLADLDREYNIVVHSVDAPESTYNVRVAGNHCLRGGQGGDLSAGIALLFVQKSGVEENIVESAFGSGILIKDADPYSGNWATHNRLTGNGVGQKLPAIVLQGTSAAKLEANEIYPLSNRSK
jgi:nitrous oxidase accessory protein NosD